MINGNSVIGIICARGGSKGFPGKNLSLLDSIPLIQWSVKAAHSSNFLDRVILSSDDPSIITSAEEVGCEVPFLRPGNLATDESKVEEVIVHALDFLGETYDCVVLLQPTSPLRAGADIDGALNLLTSSGAVSCISITENSKPPFWAYRRSQEGKLHKVFDCNLGSRRQDFELTFMPNGAVYAAQVDWLRGHGSFMSDHTIGYLMPSERSVDIDSVQDLYVAEAMLRYIRESGNGEKY